MASSDVLFMALEVEAAPAEQRTLVNDHDLVLSAEPKYSKELHVRRW